MMWRDILYFSKGERRALIVLLCLITTAFILLVLTDDRPGEGREEAASHPADTIRGSMQIDTTTVIHPGPPAANRPAQPSNRFPAKDYKRTQPAYASSPQSAKYAAGTVVELNTADSLILKKVPGIGSAFARRIVKYRTLLGGFHSVAQLGEVYGIDAERYEALKSWFIVDPTLIRRLPVNTFPADSLSKHPYISYRQARAIYNLRSRKGSLTGWENLSLLEEFTADDRSRLSPYLSFE